MVTRWFLRFVNAESFARIIAKHAFASRKSWSRTFLKQLSIMSMIGVFSRPIVSVMKSGRMFHVVASWPSEMYFDVVASFFAVLKRHHGPGAGWLRWSTRSLLG